VKEAVENSAFSGSDRQYANISCTSNTSPFRHRHSSFTRKIASTPKKSPKLCVISTYGKRHDFTGRRSVKEGEGKQAILFCFGSVHAT
jgi:hypothetical protein